MRATHLFLLAICSILMTPVIADSKSAPEKPVQQRFQIEMRFNGGYASGGKIKLLLNDKAVLINKKDSLPLKAMHWVYVLPAKAWFVRGKNKLEIKILKPTKPRKRLAKTPIKLYVSLSARTRNAPAGSKKNSRYRYKLNITPGTTAATLSKTFTYPQPMIFNYVGGEQRKQDCETMYERNLKAYQRLSKIPPYRGRMGQTVNYMKKSRGQYIHKCRKMSAKSLAGMEAKIARLEKIR